MLTIELLPAQRGDCLWLTYGSMQDKRHVIIDAGPQDTIPRLVPTLEARISEIGGRTNRIELLVITHVDADHIQGVVSLLSGPGRVPLFKDIWFNGWRHLRPGRTDLLGPMDGERLTTLLADHPERWNAAFRGKAVSSGESGCPPVRDIGGLEVTVLAPRPSTLARLDPIWTETCIKAGLEPGAGNPKIPKGHRRSGLLGFDIDDLAGKRFREDPSVPNATSITLVATYGNRSVLLLGDSPAKEVLEGLSRLGPGPHHFDAVKLSHHGSRNNTSIELCQQLRSRRWLISTNGARFHHPDPEALARIIVTQDKPALMFNYRTKHIDDLIIDAAAGHRYTVVLPEQRADGTYEDGIRLSLR